MTPTRYSLAVDNDGHEYVIPATRRPLWEAFLAIPSDDNRSWSAPKWATPIDGAQHLTFTDWREDPL